MGKEKKTRSGFLFKYLLRGLLGFVVILLFFVLIKDSEFIKSQDWLRALSDNPIGVYTVFTLSEVIFGLIPPEFFMIWSLHHGITDNYVLNILFLACISYGAGAAGYYLGSFFSHTIIFKNFYKRYLVKYEDAFRKFSGFILFVGAVTPLPFSAMCMLVGTIKYPPSRFYLITLARILRFGILGYIVWQANAI